MHSFHRQLHTFVRHCAAAAAANGAAIICPAAAAATTATAATGILVMRHAWTLK